MTIKGELSKWGEVNIVLNTFYVRFNAGVVREIIKKTLAEKLDGKEYDANQAPSITKDICTTVKEQVKGKIEAL